MEMIGVEEVCAAARKLLSPGENPLRSQWKEK
jgi:hypothetical protein